MLFASFHNQPCTENPAAARSGNGRGIIMSKPQGTWSFGYKNDTERSEGTPV